jgi:hypothetical protein
MKTDTDKQEQLREIGRNAYSAIAEMVAALNCDYDRLDELKDERIAVVDDDDGGSATFDWDEEHGEELAELRAASGECDDRDIAQNRIHEDALSVEVRSGWQTVGETLEPDEFRILITTGGPAVQIRGELDENKDPRRAWLEVQDWGTPWTQYFDADQDVLLDYARCFYFGE